MTAPNNHKVLIDKCGQFLKKQLPELRWACCRSGLLTGSGKGYRIRLTSNDNFGYLLMNGLVPRNPAVLAEINTLLLGPLKVAKRRGDGPAYLTASWPIELSTIELTDLLSLDIRRLIFGPLLLPEQLPFRDFTTNYLRDTLAVSEKFRFVPTANGSLEFLVGKGKTSLQIRAWQPQERELSLSELISNWTADTRLTKEATATTVFLLNGHLKWVRIVQRSEVIEADVTLPYRALSYRIWRLSKAALRQALSTATTLRQVQQPLVAEEVRHIVMKIN